MNVIHHVVKLWEACSTFVWCLSNSQGPPCGQRREMRPSWCRWGSRWCCSADPLQGCPLLSSSGWITVSHLHVYIYIHIIQGHKNFTTNRTMSDKQRWHHWWENRPNGCPETIYWPSKKDFFSFVELNQTSNLHNTLFLGFVFMSNSFSPCPSDFQKLPLDKRVSQALNGDLYFSNVLPDDSRPDYICYARFPHTQTIQQKQPISVTVLDSKSRHWIRLQSTVFQNLRVTCLEREQVTTEEMLLFFSFDILSHILRMHFKKVDTIGNKQLMDLKKKV